MSLDPEIAEYLRGQAALNLPPIWDVPISATRKNSQLRYAYIGSNTPIHSIKDSYIPGPTSDLHIRIYKPTDSNHSSALVFFHGGGWALGFLDLYDPCLTRLAEKSGCTIISVNYQKSPEHPFPKPFDDCYETLKWVVDHAHELGVDPTKIGVGGDSAGANLAAAVALKARDEKMVELRFQMLIYPCLDTDFQTDSYLKYAEGFGLTTKAMQWFWENYLQDKTPEHNPYARPIRAKGHQNLAPAIIVAAEYDPLTSDSYKYAEQLKDSGVSVVLKEYPGMIHGFFTLIGVTQKANDAIDYCSSKIVELTL